jgi:hypothetical protein
MPIKWPVTTGKKGGLSAKGVHRVSVLPVCTSLARHLESTSVTAVSLHRYKRAVKDGQKIAGHASEDMTRNYQRAHADMIWSEVEADSDIAEFTG